MMVILVLLGQVQEQVLEQVLVQQGLVLVMG